MYFKSKKISLIILGITALACSRIMFSLFNDPEGPNLLIVTVLAAVLFFLSLSVFLSKTPAKKLLLSILLQIILVAGLYFFLT